MSQPDGRIVRIRTFDDRGAYSDALWWAAVDDDAGAVRAVMHAARTISDQGVAAVGRLDAAQIRQHGLLAGQAVAAKG